MKPIFRVIERGDIHKTVFPNPSTERKTISRNRKLLRIGSNNRAVFRNTGRLEGSVLNIM